MSKVFITGATGFIGSNLVEKLLKKDYEIKVLVRSKKKLGLFKWEDKVEVIYGDILVPESLSGKINDCEIIIHSAALITFWNRIWEKAYKVNVTGTRNILDEALKSGCKKFIHVSSVAAIGYGENGESINEDHPYNWNRHKICYMETKYQAEQEVYNAIKKGLIATIVNPANVWGAGEYKGQKVMLFKAIKLGFPFYIEAGTNFVDVDAVCEGIINAMELGKCKERYILGGENLTINELFGIIAEELKVRKPFLRLPNAPIGFLAYVQEVLGLLTGITPKLSSSQLFFLDKMFFYDNAKAIRELKMPFISMKESVHKTISFYKKLRFL